MKNRYTRTPQEFCIEEGGMYVLYCFIGAKYGNKNLPFKKIHNTFLVSQTVEREEHTTSAISCCADTRRGVLLFGQRESSE